MKLLSQIEDEKHALLNYYEKPSVEITKWKEGNRKVFGYLCSYVPEEILFAAEILPVRIFGHLGDLTASTSHFQPFVCRLVKSVLDAGLTGKLDFLDGLIVSYTCDGMRMLYDSWYSAVSGGFTYLLDLPSSLDRAPNRKYFEESIRELVKEIECFGHDPLNLDKLRESIKVYNRYRVLAKKLHTLRLNNDLPLSSSEVLKINLGAMRAPKDRHNEVLSRFLVLLEEWVDTKATLPSPPKPKIHVSGSLVVDPVFYEIIDKAGGVVVSDDLCTGTRYYWDQVEETVDPLKGLINRYLSKVTCPSKYPSQNRPAFVLDRIRESSAQGVIIIGEKFCDPHLFDLPAIQKKIEALGVSTLWLETELAASGQEQLMTRIESFMGILKKDEEQ